MAHFAKLNDQNIVIDVTEVNDADCPSEAEGILFLQSIFGGNWVQTFLFNQPWPNPYPRGKYSAIGDTWNASVQVFMPTPPNVPLE
jgi:hypothetical protein